MKTVIEMAEAVGITDWTIHHYGDSLEDFAELVRADAIADEREACAQLCEDQWQTAHDIQDAIRARENT